MDSVTDGASYNTDRDGNPNVFNLERNDDGLWLNDNWTKPSNEWNSDNEFAFRFRNCLLFHNLKIVVFLFQIIPTFLPPAEHLANFLQF